MHPDVCELDVRGTKINPKSQRRDALTLYVSSNGKDFEEVCMPTELSDAAYTMISTQDGRGAFMIADHVDRDAAISNLCAPPLHVLGPMFMLRAPGCHLQTLSLIHI